MKQYWFNLSRREQWLIATTTTILILFLLYLFVLSPLNKHLNQIAHQVQSQQQLLIHLQSAKHQMDVLGIDAEHLTLKKISSEELLPLIINALEENQIKSYTTLVKPIDNKTVYLQFKSAPFDALLFCLSALWQNYEIKTIKLNAVPLQTTGLVNAVIVLSLQA